MRGVTGFGDRDLPSCGTTTRNGGSLDVFVNGKMVSRQGDFNKLHDNCNDSTHVTSITTGSSTVLINGKGCGRVGDAIGCGTVAEGSLNVLAGD